MDEELYQLLSEGKKKGYDDKKLKSLIDWYHQNKPPASFEKPKPSSNYLNYLKEEETPEAYTPLTNLGVKAYDELANQFPATIAKKDIAVESARDFDSELVQKFTDESAKNGEIIFPSTGKDRILEAAKKKYFSEFGPDFVESEYKRKKLEF